MEGGASAALAASIFHFHEYSIEATKHYLAAHGVPVRLPRALSPLGPRPEAPRYVDR